MWYLTNKKTGHVYYLVSQPASHTVGRVNTELLIQNDDSISRQHAMLQPDKDVLRLTDTGSRYGTYVNGGIAKVVCIRKDQATELRDGDIVQFGRCGSSWTVGMVNFHCLTSTLAMSNELKTILQKIGAELKSAYAAGLTHLIMPTITVTTKLLLGLVAQLAVVTPDYFTAIDACITQGKAFPPVTDFIPTCTESDIRNDVQMFKLNPARRHLFKAKEFIFFNTSQWKQYEEIIKLAGGACLCAQREKIAKTRFVQPNVVTIKLKELASSQSQSLDTLDKQFTARGIRMIPEVEIGLAILYGSTDKYCNPTYNFAFNVEVRDESVPVETEEILAKNSMNTESVDTRKKTKVELNTIPETEPNTEHRSSTIGQDIVGSDSKASVCTVSDPANAKPSISPLGPRRSKRFAENETKNVRPVPDKDTFQEPKRQRRATLISPSKSVSATDSNDLREESAPVSKGRSTPQPQCASQAAPSPVVSSVGFQAVNRKPQPPSMDTNNTAHTGRANSRRRANMLLQADDDDLFNIEVMAPRKRAKKGDPSVLNAVSTSTVQENHTMGRKKSPNEDPDDLFSSEDNLQSQRSGGSNRRNPNARALVDNSAIERNTISSSSRETLESTSASPISNPVSNSPFSRYRTFMKPIENSTAAWLSSTMCGLKLELGDNDESPQVKIKHEPLDSMDGVKVEDKHWVAGMSNIFQVQEKSMNVAVHHPPAHAVASANGSYPRVNGQPNFKAFVKKRNYQVQQTGFELKLVCALDETQAA